MAEQVRDFSELKSALIKAPTTEEAEAPPTEAKPKLDNKGRAYATGTRKDA
ncbi:MAG: 30S ribosomal protein S9, partial [Proteobacteria bacterium]|nr:30S ribosomal protein S9 [Pseudomonadota bacterium]